MLQTEKRIDYLDGLRGVLAIIVFVHHFLLCFNPVFVLGGFPKEVTSSSYSLYKIIAYSPLNLFFNSNMAVTFFFVLSGYVLSYNYFALHTKIKPIQKAIFKRYFRLVIPIFASCVLIWIFHKLNLFTKNVPTINDINKNWLASLFHDTLSFMDVVKYSFIDVMFKGNATYNSVLWTMSIELIGSLIVFISLLVTHKLKNKLIIFSAILIIELAMKYYHLVPFTMGMLICYLYYHNTQFVKLASSNFVKISILIIGLYFASFPSISYNQGLVNTIYNSISFCKEDGLSRLSFSFGCSFLLIFLLNNQVLKNFFASKLLLFFGKISFSFYLLHLCFIFIISTNLYAFLYKYLLDYINIPLTLLLSFCCITGISYLFYRFVDFYSVKFAPKISQFIFRI